MDFESANYSVNLDSSHTNLEVDKAENSIKIKDDCKVDKYVFSLD